MINDYITGLLNSTEFMAKASELVRQNADRRFAIIANDISNFKYVNDFYGMTEGDNLIREMADFFFLNNPRCLTACRTGCDQFRGLFDITGRSDEEETDVIVRMNIEFEQRTSAKYANIFFHMYTGIYFLDNNTEDVRIAADRAHMAKKLIKGKFDRWFAIYNPENFRQMRCNMEMLNEFIYACDNDGILMYLQPKFSISQNRVVGAEALVRMRGRNGDIVYPNDFIPVLETTGMIGRLDEIMIEQLFALQRKWIDNGIETFPISVNVSRIKFSKINFADEMIALQQKYNIPPYLIDFEITETVFIEAMDYITSAINKLRNYGFKVSVDDFGSGFSSLNQIASIPADIIKIDRVFASSGLENPKGRIVIKLLLQMLQDINYAIVFEGIETASQRDYVAGFGCDCVQGYLYSKPIPLEQFEVKYTKKRTAVRK